MMPKKKVTKQAKQPKATVTRRSRPSKSKTNAAQIHQNIFVSDWSAEEAKHSPLDGGKYESR